MLKAFSIQKNKISGAALVLMALCCEIVLGLFVMMNPVMAPFAAVSFFGFVLILNAPSYGLIFIILLLPFQNELFSVVRIGNLVLRPFEVASAVFFGAWLVQAALIKRHNPFVATGVEAPLFIFAVWCFLSGGWTINTGGYISKIIQLTFGILFIYSFNYCLNSISDFKHLMWVWAIIGTLASMTAIVEFGFLGVVRPSSFDTEALTLAEHLNYPIIMAISLFRLSSSRKVMVLIAGMIIIMLGAHLTTSARGPFLALMTGVTFFAFSNFRISNLIIWTVPVFVILSLILLNADIAQPILFRFSNLFKAGTTDPGVSFRLYVWGVVLTLFLSHPFVGLGLGSLEHILPALTDKTAKMNVIAQNSYFEILVSLGFIGMISFVWLLLRIIKLIRRELKKKQTDVLRIILLGLSSALLTKGMSLSYGVFIEDEFFWILLALALAAVRLSIIDSSKAACE